jgi:type IV secretion system protein VirB6
MSVAPINVAIFQPLMTMFDTTVNQTIMTGSANLITLISPLVAAGLGVYMLLIMTSYWRGATDQPLIDFFMRFAAWGLIITAGMNIQYYTEYVVPFFNGVGDDIAQALTNSPSTGTALDTLLSSYLTAINNLFAPLSPFNVGGYVASCANALLIILVALPFLALAAAYLILAKFALGLLLALGPMFIAAALFPATRKFFEAWTAQCLNYAFLTALFAAAGAIEVKFATASVPAGSLTDIPTTAKLAMMGITFIVVSLNLPALASALAGGVGISAMAQHAGGPARFAGKSVGKGISSGYRAAKQLTGRAAGGSIEG